MSDGRAIAIEALAKRLAAVGFSMKLAGRTYSQGGGHVGVIGREDFTPGAFDREVDDWREVAESYVDTVMEALASA